MKVKPFDLIRWARKQASVVHTAPDGSDARLTSTEGHVLLVLATYANMKEETEWPIAWPSVSRIALDCGLKVHYDKKNKSGRSAAVSAALSRLAELGLIRTKQGGSARRAKRELLFVPESQPHVHTGGSDDDQSDASLTATREASLTSTRTLTTNRSASTANRENGHHACHTASRVAGADGEEWWDDDYVEHLSEDELQDYFHEVAKMPPGVERERRYGLLRATKEPE